MANELKSMKKRKLHILVVALTKAPPNYEKQVAHRDANEQQMCSSLTRPSHCNWSCESDGYDGGPHNYGYNQVDGS